MKTPRILATSGGFVEGPVQMSWRLGTMVLDALASTEKVRPRVCLVNTAMGDNLMYYAFAYEAFNAAGCDVTEFKVFPQPSADPEERLCDSDLVWVGGGSVANGLGVVPYANGVHYGAETQRRPLLHKLMKDEVLSSLAYATDNTVGIWYEGVEATTVVSDASVDPDSGPAAYKVELIDGEIVETRFGVGTSLR